jgi:hypothetical protein
LANASAMAARVRSFSSIEFLRSPGGVLLKSENPNFSVQLSDATAAASEIAQDLLTLNASIEADVDTAFFVQRRIDGLMVGSA